MNSGLGGNCQAGSPLTMTLRLPAAVTVRIRTLVLSRQAKNSYIRGPLHSNGVPHDLK